ncbi:MAG: hypothetical protein MMC33_005897 [Icmadophila ericetorum]|nr:hypothetical protein [Icmadophila ericetorum]
MRLSTCQCAAALTALLASTASAQVLATLPPCLGRCVNSFDSNCGTATITCVCQLAATTDFLSDVLTCYQNTCGGGPDFDIVLSALQPACLLVEESIPTSIIQYVQSVEIASYPSQTLIPGGGITTTDGGVIGILPSTTEPASAAASTTEAGGDFITTTVVGIYASGSVTETVAVPEIFNSATTMYGNPVIVYPSGQHSVATPVPLGGSTDASSTLTTVPTITNSPSFVGTLSPSSISVPPVTGITLATTPSAIAGASSTGSGSGNATPFSAGTRVGGSGSSVLGLMVGIVLVGTVLL